MSWWMRILAGVLVVGITGCVMPPESSPSATAASPAAMPLAATPVQAGQTTQQVTAMPRVTPVPSGSPAREMPAPGILPKSQHTPLPFPQPGDAQLSTAAVDLTSFTVASASGGKLKLAFQGNLPTPCHQLRVTVERAERTLKVRVYSVVDPQQVCVQVLQPFSAEVEAGPFPDGDYQVFVNGNEAGSVAIRH